MGCNSSVEEGFTPDVGFVIKTKKADDAKVFVNVFQHHSVDYIVSGAPKMASNKVDEMHLTFDVVINNRICSACLNDDSVKNYVSVCLFFLVILMTYIY